MIANDKYLPNFHYIMTHVHKSPISNKKGVQKLLELDLKKSILIKSLFWLRGLKSNNFKQFMRLFTLLEQDDNHIVLGLVGKPWKLTEGVLKLSPQEFIAFNEPGYAKILWSFDFTPQQVITQTRIHCTDATSLKRFKVYWFFVRPFSGLIRKEILRLLTKKLE